MAHERDRDVLPEPSPGRDSEASRRLFTYGALIALVLGGAFFLAAPSYATDVTLEVLRASITGLLVALALWIGAREQLHRERGWWFIVGGLALLFLGSVVDITDNYEALNKYHVIGDTTHEAFVEKYVGFLGGFVLLLLGAANWLPLVGRTRQARDELSRRHELVLSTAGEGIYGLDLEGKTTFVNPAAARMIGWQVSELIGLPQHSVLHHSRPDGTPYPREECPIYAAFTDGQVHSVDDEVFWRKDGSSFPVEYVSTPLREAGELVGAVVTFSDITARLAADQTLRDGEARLRAVLETAATGIITIDQRGVVQTVNPSGEQMFGYSAAEMVGRNVTMLMPEPYASEHDEYLSRYLETGESHVIGIGREVVGRRKDGTEFPLDLAVSEVVLEGERTFTGIVADLSERQRLQRLHASVVRVSADLIVLADFEGRFTLVSDSVSPLLGHSPEELTETSYLDIIAPQSRADVLDVVARLAGGGDASDFQCFMLRKDGGLREFAWHATITSTGPDGVIVAVGRDVTERGEAERRLATELDTARSVQLSLQPAAGLVIGDLEVAGVCAPAAQVGGDFLDWYEQPGGVIAVTIGDVMGKGIPAALLMSMAQATMRSEVRADPVVASDRLGEQFSSINNLLYEHLDSAGAFVTAFTALVAPDGDVAYADAGHGLALIRRSDGRFESLLGDGLPFGVLSDSQYATGRDKLEAGDSLILLTDGVRDVLDHPGASTPWPAILDVAAGRWDGPDAANRIVDFVEQSAATESHVDDLTVVILSHGLQSASRSDEPDAEEQQIADAVRDGTWLATLPVAFDQLAGLEAAFTAFLEGRGVSEDAIMQVTTALHEVLTNVIEHAQPSEDISVAATVDDATVEIIVRDNGSAFTGAKSQGDEEVVERGRGLAMSAELLDDVDYSRVDGENRWRLRKRYA